MSALTAKATTLLTRAKAAYTHRLAMADLLLQSAVCQNPANLTNAETLQATYTTGIAGATLRVQVHELRAVQGERLNKLDSAAAEPV